MANEKNFLKKILKKDKTPGGLTVSLTAPLYKLAYGKEMPEKEKEVMKATVNGAAVGAIFGIVGGPMGIVIGAGTGVVFFGTKALIRCAKKNQKEIKEQMQKNGLEATGEEVIPNGKGFKKITNSSKQKDVKNINMIKNIKDRSLVK